MADLTRTIIKKNLRTPLEKLEDLKSDLEALKDDVENESYSIEPYEGKDDLTPYQEERQEWLDNVSEALGTIIDGMDTSELEGYVEE